MAFIGLSRCEIATILVRSQYIGPQYLKYSQKTQVKYLKCGHVSFAVCIVGAFLKILNVWSHTFWRQSTFSTCITIKKLPNCHNLPQFSYSPISGSLTSCMFDQVSIYIGVDE